MFVLNALRIANTVLVFDRYYTNSTKAHTRQIRQEKQGVSRTHVLKPDMQTPSKKSILGVPKNKEQLNKMLADALLEPQFFETATHNGHTLTLAGVEDAPMEITHGIKINRHDLSSSHEEADLIIAQHAIFASSNNQSVAVISDDTDVFALLLHF